MRPEPENSGMPETQTQPTEKYGFESGRDVKGQMRLLMTHSRDQFITSHRETDRQTDRRTEGQTDRQTNRQTHRHTDRHTDIQSSRAVVFSKLDQINYIDL